MNAAIYSYYQQISQSASQINKQRFRVENTTDILLQYLYMQASIYRNPGCSTFRVGNWFVRSSIIFTEVQIAAEGYSFLNKLTRCSSLPSATSCSYLAYVYPRLTFRIFKLNSFDQYDIHLLYTWSPLLYIRLRMSPYLTKKSQTYTYLNFSLLVKCRAKRHGEHHQPAEHRHRSHVSSFGRKLKERTKLYTEFIKTQENFARLSCGERSPDKPEVRLLAEQNKRLLLIPPVLIASIFPNQRRSQAWNNMSPYALIPRWRNCFRKVMKGAGWSEINEEMIRPSVDSMRRSHSGPARGFVIVSRVGNLIV